MATRRLKYRNKPALWHYYQSPPSHERAVKFRVLHTLVVRISVLKKSLVYTFGFVNFKTINISVTLSLTFE